MFEQPRQNATPSSSHDDPLRQLAAVPRDALDRAISHGKDVADSLMRTAEDSQIAIAWAVREAMQKLEIGVYQLHELTGLSCDFIDAILEGVADITDSEPISKLESALHVSLNHL